jgi:hypothetical protein
MKDGKRFLSLSPRVSVLRAGQFCSSRRNNNNGEFQLIRLARDTHFQINPLIWRRPLVRSDSSIATL